MSPEMNSSSLHSDAAVIEYGMSSAVAIRELPRSERPLGGLASWRATRVRAYIEAHLAQRMSMELLASVALMSQSHFCRSFKQSHGLTVHGYVMARRMQRAKHLMLTTKASLAEIATACGMSDQSHLTRMFSRSLHESPSAWRRRNRAMSERPDVRTLSHGVQHGAGS